MDNKISDDHKNMDFVFIKSDKPSLIMQIMKEECIEFENFCQKTRNVDHVIAMDEQATTGNAPLTRHRTTEELFELFMEQQTKK